MASTILMALATTVYLTGVAYPTTSLSTKVEISPSLGMETSATAGSVMFERSAMPVLAAVEIAAATSFRFNGNVPAGSILAISQDDKHMTACQREYEYEPICLTDKNLDGAFESVNTWAGLFPSKLNPPIAYTRGKTLPATDAGKAFKQTLIYLGMSGPTLRLSYREFVNDMARPAFTEEVTFNLSGKYPETVAYKDIVIDVLGAGNSGLSYVIRKANAAPSEPTEQH